MGVPKIAGWFFKKLKANRLLFDNVDNIDNFYFDANCLLHPTCFQVLKFISEWEDEKKLEDVMFERIVNYFDYIIGIVNPRNKLVISVDGVAPQAKSNQQRLRRFKSYEDKVLEKNNDRLDVLFSKELHDKNEWLNTKITPGTEFMERLHTRLKKYINNMKCKYEVVYSSYHTPGEGEHKIMEDIRKEENKNKVCCIYGLDADLIFLSIATQRDNMYLLRETTVFGRPKNTIDFENGNPETDVEQELQYLSIDKIKYYLFDLVLKKMKDFKFDMKKIKLSQQQFCDDFTFFCYFLGNDFLQNIPSLDISTGGLDICINVYINIYKKLNEPLILDNGKRINNAFLKNFIFSLSRKEEYYFSKILPDFLQRNKYIKTLDTKLDKVKLGQDESYEYKYRYYEHYLGISLEQNEAVNIVCYEYFKGLKWILEYYYKGCPSWSWKYPFYVSPFLSDLSNFLHYSKEFDINKITFTDCQKLTPCQQLLSVIPPSCSYLVPESYKKLMKSSSSPIIDLFPLRGQLDKINKLVEYKCYPKIPFVDVKRIIESTKDLILSSEEKIRNSFEPEFCKNKKI